MKWLDQGLHSCRYSFFRLALVVVSVVGAIVGSGWLRS